jgi:farnesyl-diphosphate farnesyltransferase
MDSLEDLLLKASRTFALTIPLLDPPLRRPMGIAYLLMRNADTLEDAWLVPKQRRLDGLRRFADLVRTQDAEGAEGWVRTWADQPGFDDRDHHDVLMETPRILRDLSALEPAMAELIADQVVRVADRMTGWVERHDERGRLSLGSLRDLDDYCYAVAGIVGEMITEMAALTVEELPLGQLLFLRSVAADFGAGLQLTNIVKDSWRDAQEGRHYLPRDFLPAPGGDAAEHLQPIVLLALARLDQGIEYTCALPSRDRGLRLFCLLPLVLAAATLREVHDQAAALWAGVDVKVSRAEVGDLLGRSHLAVDDNTAVRGLWAELTVPVRALRRALSA